VVDGGQVVVESRDEQVAEGERTVSYRESISSGRLNIIRACLNDDT